MANSCETCKHYEVEAYNEPCVSCRFRDYDVPTKWENPFRSKTNADRIRAMSDEELVKLIGHNSLCDQIQNNNRKWCEDRAVCNNCLNEWLKQPSEETGNAE